MLTHWLKSVYPVDEQFHSAGWLWRGNDPKELEVLLLMVYAIDSSIYKISYISWSLLPSFHLSFLLTNLI